MHSLLPKPSVSVLFTHSEPTKELGFGERVSLVWQDRDGACDAYLMGIHSDGPLEFEVVRWEDSGATTLIREVRGVVLNLMPYRGNSGEFWDRYRLPFEVGPFRILLEPFRDAMELASRPSAWDAFQATHSILIKRRDGKSFSNEKAGMILEVIGWALSLISGRRIGITYARGVDRDGDEVWTRFGPRACDEYSRVRSWASENAIPSALGIANDIWKLWSAEGDRDWITVAIGFYLETCKRSSGSELCILGAYSALELLAWVRLVEKAKLFSKESAFDRNVSSDDKVRLLLHDCKVRKDLPSILRGLEGWQNKDGPSYFCNVRNLIAHPSSPNRAELKRLDGEARYGVSQVGAYYVEMALLCCLGYVGSYNDRAFPRTAPSLFSRVPWAATASSA